MNVTPGGGVWGQLVARREEGCGDNLSRAGRVCAGITYDAPGRGGYICFRECIHMFFNQFPVRLSTHEFSPEIVSYSRIFARNRELLTNFRQKLLVPTK